MKVTIVGATGNVGTALLTRLREAGPVDGIAGVARRLPDTTSPPYADVEWHRVDIADPACVDSLAAAMRGADAVVHLSWLIQPSHDAALLRQTNVEGTRHVVHAVVRAGVPHLVVASSVGAYAAGPKDRAVDETWPTTGIPSSGYSRDKAAVERLLDQVEEAHPDLVVSRLRPGLIFQEGAGSEITRYFVGPLVPVGLLRHVRLPLVPLSPRLVFQAVHAADVADAYRRVVEGRVPGAFNVAAEPVLGPAEIAGVLGGRPVPVPLPVLRALASATWHARLQPTGPGWIDLAGDAPVMDTTRARVELGWEPRHSAVEALRAVVTGMAEGAGRPSPPLEPQADE